jgi:hypothetical protein
VRSIGILQRDGAVYPEESGTSGGAHFDEGTIGRSRVFGKEFASVGGAPDYF